MKSRFPYARTFLLGFGFFGISLIWPIFNNYVPIFLQEGFGLSATLTAFVMTWDNYLNMFVQPLVGERSDRLQTRIGRRKPFMLVGAPLAAVFFILVPTMGGVAGIMFAILLTNLSMALFRAPTIALLGDLFPSHQRSMANGIINLMGGIGSILAFLVGGLLYRYGRITPFAFGSVVMLAAITTVLLFVREPSQPVVEEKKGEEGRFLTNLKEVMQSQDRSGLLILLAILCWFLGFNAMETWISSFGKFTLGIDEGRMGILTSGLALMFVVFALPSGMLATRFGRRRIILVGITGLTLLLVYGLFVQNQAMLISFLVPAGFFWALSNVNSLPMVYDVGGDARIGAFTGLYYLASNIAAVGGPQIVGALIDLSGGNYRLMFVFSAVFMALAGVCMARVRERKQTVQERTPAVQDA
ncbi:MAG: SLC45 family MFS transporter [Chloroflexi bacterium]|nr:SLC45 family MFS transporter [Chloroflexota bacterium]